MKNRLFWRQIAFPVFLCLFLVGFTLLYRWANLPSPEEIVEISKSYFREYGYFIVFAGALLEATLLINFYLPGSTVVVLAVAYSSEGHLNVYYVLALASIAFVIGYIFDYFMGLWGWYRLMVRFGLGNQIDNASKRIGQHGLGWLWIVYFHPNSAAIAATAAGVLQVPLFRFIMTSVAAVAFWSTVWGLIAYFGATEVLQLLDMRWLIGIALIWLVISIIRALRHTQASDSS